MPNWVRNEITINGPEGSVKALLKKTATKESRFDFNGLVPMPAHIYKGLLSSEERARYGDDNWYDWSYKHWGTKWNAADAAVMYHGGETAFVDFETAWCAPIPIYEAIRKKFPDLDVQARYADEDIGSNCGTWHNGELEKIEEPQRAFEFACDVWGYDPDELREERGC